MSADTCQYVNAAMADYDGKSFSFMVGLRPMVWYSYEEYKRAWGIQSMAVVAQLDTLGRVSIIRHDFPPAYRPQIDRRGCFLILPHPEARNDVWTQDSAHAAWCAKNGYIVVSAAIEASLGGYVYEYTPLLVNARYWAVVPRR